MQTFGQGRWAVFSLLLIPSVQSFTSYVIIYIEKAKIIHRH